MKRVCRIAPRATEGTAGQPYKDAGLPCIGGFPLDTVEDLGDSHAERSVLEIAHARLYRQRTIGQ